MSFELSFFRPEQAQSPAIITTVISSERILIVLFFITSPQRLKSSLDNSVISGILDGTLLSGLYLYFLQKAVMLLIPDFSHRIKPSLEKGLL